jgi:hypothetical protein
MKRLYEFIVGIAVVGVVIAGIAGAFKTEPGLSALASSAAQAATATPFPTCTPTPGPGTPTPTPETGLIPDRFIIGVNAQPGDPSVSQLVADLSQQYGLTVRAVFDWMPGFSATVPAQNLASLQADSRVTYTSQDASFPLLSDYPPCSLPTPTLTPTRAT